MFNSRSRSGMEENATGATTIIGAGTTIIGDMESKGDIRIDGTLKGNLMAKAKILVGTDGVVEGNMNGNYADIQGRVTGNIRTTDLLLLRGSAHIEGDIYAGKLQVEPTVSFNGKCHMGANIVELNAELPNAVNQ